MRGWLPAAWELRHEAAVAGLLWILKGCIDVPAFDSGLGIANGYYKFNCILLRVLPTIVDFTARKNGAGPDTLSRYGDNGVWVGLVAQRHRAYFLNHDLVGLAGAEHFVMNGIVGFLDVIRPPCCRQKKKNTQENRK